MYYIQIYQPKFNSNIYVYRKNLSQWLTKFVDVRNNIGTYVMTPDNISQLDMLLKQYHYKFEEVVNTINLLENDVETYGG